MKAKIEVQDARRVLFSNYHRTLLEILFAAESGLHVRELARMAQYPVGSVHRELGALAGAGLLLKTKLGNRINYRPDPVHPLYAELAAIFGGGTKTRLRAAESPPEYMPKQPARRDRGSKRARCVVIAGPNGAGKTTFARDF